MKLLPVCCSLLGLLFSTSVFADDLLNVYEMALTHDARLREAAATLNAIREVRPQSMARLLPHLNIKGDLTGNSVRSSFQQPPNGLGVNPLMFFTGGTNIDYWNSTASINVLQPLYHHEYWVQLNQADKKIAQAEATFAAEQQTLIKRVTESYFDALYAEDSLAFYEAELSAIGIQLEKAKASFDAGLVPITDVHEAQAAYHRARANSIKAANQLQDSVDAVELITGSRPGRLNRLRQTLLLIPPEPKQADDWVNHALQSNLELIAAHSQLEQFREQMELQFAGHLPSVDLVGSAGFTDNNRPYGISTQYQVVGMQVNLPVFEGGGVNARVRQARYEFDAAQEHLDGLRRSVSKNVREAYRAILSAMGQIEALEATQSSASSALEAVQTGFDVGTRTMVDVLAEQALLYQARRDYSKARYEYVLSRFKLKWACGVLTVADILSLNQGLEPVKTAQ